MELVNKFIDIGFRLNEENYIGGAAWNIEYNYHPDYLIPNYYKLVVFSYGLRDESVDYKNADYRLYILNEDHQYIDNLFDCNLTNAKIKFNKVFRPEIINKILIS